MSNARLRCPLSVELLRDPVVEEYIRSLRDHQPPELEDQDVITINTPPPYIENSDSDSDVICLDWSHKINFQKVRKFIKCL